MRWTWMVVLALSAGCDGIDLGQLVRQHEPLTLIIEEPAGPHCEHGGSAVLTGLDLDDDDVLADDEVKTTTYDCDDAPPSALTRTREEPAGTHCLNGGRAVETGLDVDASGTLEDAEVTATEYLCATAIPRVLMRAQAVPPGQRCALGGQVSRAGYDVNDNSELEDGEVTREVYGCTEPDTVVTRASPAPSQLSPCVPEGSLVEAGVDLDRDGVLDDDERRASVIACTELPQLRVRQRPEPIGAACAAGGIRVEVGADDDGDGTFEDQEVGANTTVCHPARTFDGTFEVKSAADVAALQGIGRVRGSLHISSSVVNEVVLPGLQSVEGQLLITNNGSLTRVELTGLRFVAEDVLVINNSAMGTLKLGNQLGSGSRLWIAGDLNVETNASLPTLFGLRSAVPGRNITLSDNDAMVTSGTFDDVRELKGSIVVSDNDALLGLPFASLFRVGGSFTITSNKVLPNLTCATLTYVGDRLEISRNAALTDLSGMPALESVAGSLAVSENDGMLSTAGMDSLNRVGSLHVARNPLLETVAAFPMLRSVGSLSVSENAKLTSLGTFQLRSLDSLFVNFNPLLTHLKGLERLESLRVLGVEFSNGLTTLADLGHVRSLEQLTLVDNLNLTRLDLTALQRVDNFFTIVDNPKLPTCLATSLATLAYKGGGGAPQISGNDSTATCD
ncbi:DUF7151 family protein [Pyxidicoccus sp. MSG2]|uniref:DUF7151 family protein n=1 Tax=Pyxidicoccus sp. MSG2 TaxID=2996790 RepID=UPI00226D58A5|nr:hypothetical protein [Pyxidicoccus sp. MSG2]MCY1019498.1 hypothetical protein [Pyxidicoccus sp. MSG2]